MRSIGPYAEQVRRRRRQARRRVVIRRRRAALGAIAALAAIAGAAVGAGREGGTGQGEGQLAAAPACPDAVAADPRRLAGQMLVVRMEGDLEPSLLRAARRGEIGGVIVFPPTGEPREVRPAIRRLRRAAAEGSGGRLLVMVDQEGGGASRFPLAPPRRAPTQLAEIGNPRDARLEGQATGHFLDRLGIDIDLAPVIDVPVSVDAAMALRAFGDDERQVARLGLAFAAGLEDEGTIAVPKHFPGLGRTDVTTDAAPVTIDASARQLDRDLLPFREAVARDARMVMVGLAAYPAHGSDLPAALAPEIISGLLRDELGFSGVVITDDLEAPAIAAAGIGEGRAAVAAAEAGADLLLFALGGGGEALPALARAIRRGRLDAGALRESCARLTELRSRLDGR